ncbi:MAG: alanine--tRNA ligase [Candidatus Omnitrophota bacterium]|nr:MAG: alanine--tRNA ligase [Candidatus Omnitrophota bacterium]
MKTDELRNRFLEFFKSKDHKVFPSDTLVPDDPTVLFTSAGMNQFKPYFLGEKKDVKKAASAQKCLRTDDLEKVGLTPYHHTFFEMLGNFSFGDYFKREAIEYAWEFLTKDLNIKDNNLWISVYRDDNQAWRVWSDHIGVPQDKIVKLDEDKNFWPAAAPTVGPNGPCGPCSEIFFDKGKDKGCGKKTCSPACECGRFVEVWNLVFTQFNRVGKNELQPLPQKNIDTGMGLERMVSVLQGKDSNFEIDIFAPIVARIEMLLGKRMHAPRAQSLIRATADHLRAAVFSIADGIYPSNEARGYVIRKIIRKAIWSAHLLGKKDPFLFKLVPLCAELMRGPYPEIGKEEGVIQKVIRAEEEKFLSTLDAGQKQLLEIIKKTEKEKRSIIDAESLFFLYDTHGFPPELSKEVARKHNIDVDQGGFELLLKKQQERSRKKSMFDESIFKEGMLQLEDTTQFVGYHHLEAESNIIRLLENGQDVDTVGEGRDAAVVTDTTPFYPSGGGQLTDKGIIITDDGEFAVRDVLKVGNTIVHRGRVQKGQIRKGKAYLKVDQERRRALMRAHTATHLLQAALRGILGVHVTQQGSLVDEDKLRFDFTHFQALTPQELLKVGALVNNSILHADEVRWNNLLYDEAKQQGALAFFKDKYDSQVRVVSILGYSKELCGGTHLNNTAEVGSFVILSEASISSGIRRIEAIVGKKAYNYLNEVNCIAMEVAGSLKTTPAGTKDAVSRLLADLKKEKDKVAGLEKKFLSLRLHEVLKKAHTIGGIHYLVYSLPDKDYPSLMALGDMLRKELKTAFIFLISAHSGRDIFVCTVTGDLIKKGLTSKGFVTRYKEELFLKGGGKDNLVQGVIGKKQKDFLAKVSASLKQFLKK